mmetsp:Transcript_5547/g.15059  ORF Transcript_5547/g.15059 Transcript_5547/m.15059 type:complete len:306 (+) Transcript_5547:354-1271(+)
MRCDVALRAFLFREKAVRPYVCQVGCAGEVESQINVHWLVRCFELLPFVHEGFGEEDQVVLGEDGHSWFFLPTIPPMPGNQLLHRAHDVHDELQGLSWQGACHCSFLPLQPRRNFRSVLGIKLLLQKTGDLLIIALRFHFMPRSLSQPLSSRAVSVTRRDLALTVLVASRLASIIVFSFLVAVGVTIDDDHAIIVVVVIIVQDADDVTPRWQRSNRIVHQRNIVAIVCRILIVGNTIPPMASTLSAVVMTVTVSASPFDMDLPSLRGQAYLSASTRASRARIEIGSCCHMRTGSGLITNRRYGRC